MAGPTSAAATLGAAVVFVLADGCPRDGGSSPAPSRPTAQSPAPQNPPSRAAADPLAESRARMIEDDLRGRGVTAPEVLAAMAKVPREAFVPDDLRALAYADQPLPLLHGATISQPYIVALMTSLANVEPGDRVLEVGTGSGYQAAVLAELGARVCSIELEPELARSAAARLERLGYRGIDVRAGDGWAGWPEPGEFDAIVVTAAPPSVPEALLARLALGGRLVIPVGTDDQTLWVYTRTTAGLERSATIPVRFVPLRHARP